MARQDVTGGNGLGKKTATAGTKIRRLLPPIAGKFTRLSTVKYTPGVTSHVLTGCRPIGKTTLAAAAAAGQAVVVCNAQPGSSGNDLAANDLVAIQETDGITRLYVVSSVASFPSVTLTGNLTAGGAANANLWNYGIESDTDPVIGEAHPTWDLTTGAQRSFTDDTGGVVASHVPNSPILLSVDNATNAGVLDQTSWFHTPH